jgi:hypothetical protein
MRSIFSNTAKRLPAVTNDLLAARTYTRLKATVYRPWVTVRDSRTQLLALGHKSSKLDMLELH